MQAPPNKLSPRGGVAQTPPRGGVGDHSLTMSQAGIPWELRPKPSRSEVTLCLDKQQYLKHLNEVIKRGGNSTPIWEVSLVALTGETEHTLGTLVRHHSTLQTLSLYRGGSSDAMALLETTGAVAQKSIAKLSRAIVTSRSLVELRMIDVNINEPAFIYLAHAIAQSNSLRVFDFSQNKILNMRGYGPVQALTLALERTVSLTWLNLHRTSMARDDLARLMNAMKVNTSILFLDVSQTLNQTQETILGDDIFRYNQVLIGLRSDKWKPNSTNSLQLYSYSEAKSIFWRVTENNNNSEMYSVRSTTHTFSGQRAEKMQEVISRLALTIEDIALPGMSLSQSGIPSPVLACMMLRRLVLSANGLSSIPESISALKSLTELHVSHNRLEQFPSSFSLLTQLERLFAADNQIKEISPLKSLSLLHTLDLSRNQLRLVPPQISWPNLVMLDLAHNNLRSLPSAIAFCTNLRYLNLNKNVRFDFFPLEFSDICQNFIPEVSLIVGGVPVSPGSAMPHPLVRSGTSPAIPVAAPLPPQLSPRGGGGSSGVIGKLLPTPLSPGRSTTAANPSPPPPSISPRVSPRSNTESNIHHNANNSTTAAGNTASSQDGSSAALLTAGVGVPLLLNGTILGKRLLADAVAQLKGADRDPMPLVAVKCVELFLRLKKRYQIDTDTKLLLIGEANAGKTTLLSQFVKLQNISNSGGSGSGSGSGGSAAKKKDPLSGGKEKNVATDGIDIKSWKSNEGGETVQFRSWDFAGQEDYLLTHQFFLSKRSIYLLLFDLNKFLAAMGPQSSSKNVPPRSTERDPLDFLLYWLNSIRARANSSSVPVFLVGTHADEIKGFDKSPETFLSRLRESLQSRNVFARFPFVQTTIFALSAKKDIASILELKSQLVSCAQREFGGKNRISISPALFIFIQHLKKIQSAKFLTYFGKKSKNQNLILSLTNEYWMKWPKFRELLLAYNVPENEHQQAAQYLHETGYVVYLAEEEWSMKEHVFLNPQWLTNLLKTIFTLKHQFGKSGILRHNDLAQLWKEPDYPQELHSVLRGILERLEVLYHVKPADIRSGSTLTKELAGEFVIPSLLPDTHPDLSALWPPFAADEVVLGRVYELDFMPTGLFSRFLIRMFAYTDVYQFWRSGVLLGLSVSTASSSSSSSSSSYSSSSLAPNTASHSPSEINAWALVTVHFHTIEVKVRGVQTLQLLGIVLRTLDALLSFWYHVNVARYVPCICYSCVAQEHRQKSYAFPVTLCEAAATEGHYLLECELTGARVRLDKLMPDIMLLDVEDSSQIQQTDIEKRRELGKGAYGQIFGGVWKGKEVAIKEIYLDRLPTDEDRRKALADFRAEIKIMSSLKHPNVVSMLAYCVSPPIMVMELVPCGDLYGFLHDEDRAEISWKMRYKIAVDIAEGMAFLHSLNPPLLHRDLKSPNILLASFDENAQVVAKVADFGLSSLLVLKGFKESATDRRVENPTWQAPEVTRHLEYSQKADVYAFGLILHEIATRLHPFEEFQFRFLTLLEDAVKQGVRPTIPSSVPPQFAQLITKCWHASPAERPVFVSKTNVGASVLGQLYAIIGNLPADQQPKLLQQNHSADNSSNNNNNSDQSTVNHSSRSREMTSSLIEGTRFKKIHANFSAAILTLCVIAGGQIVAGGTKDGSVLFWAVSSGELLDRVVNVHLPEVKMLINIENRLWSAGPLDGVKVHEIDTTANTMRIPRPNFDEFSEWLEKRGGAQGNRPYKKRYFLLRAKEGILTYHAKPGAPSKGEIQLLRAQIKSADPISTKSKTKEYLLEIHSESRVYYLRFSDSTRRNKFFEALESVITHHPLDTQRPNVMRLVGSIGAGVQGLTCFTTVGNTVWLAAPGLIRQYDAKELKLIREVSIPRAEQIHCLLSHGKHVWAGLSNGQILRIEKQSGRVLDLLPGHEGRVSALASALDSVWSAGVDGAVRVWNAETGQTLRVLQAQQTAISAMSVVGSRVWTAGEDCTMKIWDAKTLASLKKLETVHSAPVLCLLVVFGRVVWSAGQDAVVNLWK